MDLTQLPCSKCALLIGRLGKEMDARLLADRIALFVALCDEIKEKAARGSLKVSHVEALRDDLVAIGQDSAISSYARGLINQSYARADAVERYLNMDDPPHVSAQLQYTVKALCETLGALKIKLEAM